ncbi:MAG: hypothetical protein K6B38_11635, partial [Ruminococcus sp.]|nr:hypothetical protein [Ruminococcus sp.]
VRIFRHNFVGDKAKIRRRAVALQGFLTQSPAKFDEKTCMNPYVDRFLKYHNVKQRFFRFALSAFSKIFRSRRKIACSSDYILLKKRKMLY